MKPAPTFFEKTVVLLTRVKPQFFSEWAFFYSCCLLVISTTHAQAQSFEGQSFKLGATSLIPELRLDYVSVDNAFRDAVNPVDATGFIVAPAFKWEADRRLLALSATYRGRYGQFSESELDFDDHDLIFRADAAPGTRHRTFGEFVVRQESEEFGTGQSQFATGLTETIEERDIRLQVGYTYGAKDARGNVGGGLAITDRSYNDLGPITDGDDFTAVAPYTFFSYRISPDTRFRTELRFTSFDFDQDTRDRDAISLLGGLDLNATERTGGRVRLGVTRSDFDMEQISDETTFVADINVFFRPRSYSRLDLLFSRDLATVDDDTNGVGESVVDDIRLSWKHGWTSRVSTTLELESERADRECPNIDTVTSGVSLEFDINVRRWLAFGAGVGTSRRTVDSCDPADDSDSREFDRDSVGVHVRMTL